MKKGAEKIREFVAIWNHSLSDEFEVEGPWAFQGINDQEAPVYIYQKGTGEKVKVGKVVAKVDKGLKFEVHLDDEYKDLDSASFEIPMRFHVKRKKDEESNDQQS